MWIKSLEFHLASFSSIYNEVVGSLGQGCFCGPEEKVTGAGGFTKCCGTNRNTFTDWLTINF